LLRALAVPPPDGLRHTSAIAAAHRDGLAAQWVRLGRPFDEELLAAALDAAGRLATDATNLLVNSDLHYDQVLRDRRGEWTVIDPAVVAGALEYQVAPLVWTRFDELGAERVRWCLDTLVSAAGLTLRLADDWALLRTAEYWLWGLDNGLTEDPVRCARICAALRPSGSVQPAVHDAVEDVQRDSTVAQDGAVERPHVEP
jgi:streptomycin 6-kinase